MLKYKWTLEFEADGDGKALALIKKAMNIFRVIVSQKLEDEYGREVR